MRNTQEQKPATKKYSPYTSDRALAATLRRNRLQIIDSEKFIKDFLVVQHNAYDSNEIKPEITSSEEVEEWLKIFSEEEE